MDVWPAELPDFEQGKMLRVRPIHATSEYLDTCLMREQRTRDDFPLWDVSIVCTQKQAEHFEFWVSNQRNKPFVKSILTILGRFDHTVVIIEQPSEPQELSNQTYRYSFRIMAQELENDYPCVDPELIDRYSPYFREIDIMINQSWPIYTEE